jgi:hypothetical protein
MKKVLAYLFGWFFVPMILNAQADSLFRSERVIRGDIRFFSADHLGNLYLVDRKDQVKKIGPKGDSLAVYNDVRRLGPLSGMDVSNPMQPLLYYGDGVRFIVLDRFLNAVTRIDLQSSNILQLQTWARSYDNQIWLFDPLGYALKKVDLTGKIQWSTPDFRLLLGRPFQPSQLFDQDRNLYLYEPSQGVYVFDYFGNLKNGIQLYDWKDLQVDGAYIYGRKLDTLYRYEIRTTFYDEWTMPADMRGAVQYLIKGNRLYCLFRSEGADQIRIFSIR